MNNSTAVELFGKSPILGFFACPEELEGIEKRGFFW